MRFPVTQTGSNRKVFSTIDGGPFEAAWHRNRNVVQQLNLYILAFQHFSCLFFSNSLLIDYYSRSSSYVLSAVMVGHLCLWTKEAQGNRLCWTEARFTHFYTPDSAVQWFNNRQERSWFTSLFSWVLTENYSSILNDIFCEGKIFIFISAGRKGGMTTAGDRFDCL